MRHPQEPHYSFTIPSIHDDTTLDCRVYHPDIVSDPPLAEASQHTSWRRRGIVMAHPYAPMGGSYDDRVVGIVIEEFLQAGWIVGTFNFRGAHGSKGRTSWTGRPELDDFTSFAAFFIHYMCYIHPLPTADTVFTPETSSNVLQVHKLSVPLQEDTPVVVLGGYSYGSLILKHLPPVLSMLQPFSTPLSGSSADEVIIRAHKLADQSNLDWINHARFRAHEQKRQRYELKNTVVMGGEDTSPDKRRSSREVRRSTDGSRSLDIKQRLRSLSHRGRRDDCSVTSKRVEITIPEVRYLLVSPLTAPISTLAAPALGPKLWGRARDGSQEMIGQLESLAIYGDQDVFASAKKIRDWADQLKADHGPRFSSVEVPGAGHFWVERGVEERLRLTLREWELGIRTALGEAESSHQRGTRSCPLVSDAELAAAQLRI